jgi:hypothetical protein
MKPTASVERILVTDANHVEPDRNIYGIKVSDLIKMQFKSKQKAEEARKDIQKVLNKWS